MDKPYIDLINTNFTTEGFLYPVDLLRGAIYKYLQTRQYNPDSKGLLVSRLAIIKNLYSSISTKPNTNEIFITSSTSESYSLIFNNFCKPGDEILFPNPTYPLFEYLAEYSHINPKYYKLAKDKNWSVDINLIESILQSDKSDKIKGIVLITPNNPTGSVLQIEEFIQIKKIAIQHNLFIIVDNVFDIFNFSNLAQINSDDLLNDEKRLKVFWLNGISKMFGLPDLKLAWIYCQNCLIEEIEKLETYNDTYLNANYLTQSILPSIMEQSTDYQKEIVEKIKNNFDTFYRMLDPNKFEFNRSNGGIHTIITLKNKSEKTDLYLQEKLLIEQNLNSHPASFYNLESDTPSLVFSMLNSQENILEGANRLNEFF